MDIDSSHFLSNYIGKKIADAASVALQAATDANRLANSIHLSAHTMHASLPPSLPPSSKPLVSIIMTYFNRTTQTKLTFDYFEKVYAGKYNIEVIVVDDSSREEESLREVIHEYSFKIKLVELREKDWINPVVPTNIAITHIDPATELVIIQNPEILHSGDVIGHALKNVTKDNYVVYPVFNSPDFKYNKQLRKLFDKGKTDFYTHFVKKIDYNLFDFDQAFYEKKYPEIAAHNYDERGSYNHFMDIDRPKGRVCNRSGIFYARIMVYKCKGWLNHPVHEDRQFHYLGAMKKTTLDEIGGFCNDMKDGLWFDDNEFINRIKRVKRVITPPSLDCMGIHQFHEQGTYVHKYVKNSEELKACNEKIMKDTYFKGVIYCDPTNEVKEEVFRNY